MKTTVKSYKNEQSLEIEHESEDCVYCEAGRHVKWQEPGDTIFFETSNPDTVQRIEVMHLEPPLVMLFCKEIARAEADKELNQDSE